jgi:hypothetical protein
MTTGLNWAKARIVVLDFESIKINDEMTKAYWISWLYTQLKVHTRYILALPSLNVTSRHLPMMFQSWFFKSIWENAQMFSITAGSARNNDSQEDRIRRVRLVRQHQDVKEVWPRDKHVRHDVGCGPGNVAATVTAAAKGGAAGVPTSSAATVAAVSGAVFTDFDLFSLIQIAK